MKRLIPLLAANALCLAAMMAFVAVIGPMVRTLGLAEWHGGLIVTPTTRTPRKSTLSF